MENQAVQKKSVLDHLMAGLNEMIPFVVAGGILMALGFALAGADAMTEGGALGQILYGIGSKHAMGLMYIVVGGFLAVSIGGQKALLAGMIGGSIATGNGSTFLGAVIAGLLAGYLVKLATERIPIPKSLSTVFDILLLPVLSALVIGLAAMYLIGTPVAFLMSVMTGFLNTLQGGNLLLLCAVLGAMMAVDLSGPILRVAYFFGVAAVAAAPGQPQTVMAAVIVGGMTPPLGMALACALQKRKFSREEQEAGRAAWILGASLINEGFIPFAVRDPKRVIPATAIGSAVAGAAVAFFGAGTSVVHGGLFILPIPGAVRNPLGYVLATAIGTVVTAAIVLALKKNAPAAAPAELL